MAAKHKFSTLESVQKRLQEARTADRREELRFTLEDVELLIRALGLFEDEIASTDEVDLDE